MKNLGYEMTTKFTASVVAKGIKKKKYIKIAKNDTHFLK